MRNVVTKEFAIVELENANASRGMRVTAVAVQLAQTIAVGMALAS
jgi:hypothetical protein